MNRAVLVVEDDELNLKLTRAVLATHGYEAVCASNGGEAVEMARTRRPAIVLLDMNLPDMAGLEVLRRLRSLPETRDLPIVAMTAQAMAGDRERFLGAGGNGYITKPISIQAFLAEVERQLAGTAREDQT